MQLFYDPYFSDQSYTLNAEESYHAVKVLRKQAGDKISITNGIGDIFEAEISNAHQKRCEVTIIHHKKMPEPTGYFHLAIAPTKNTDRMEWLVEKCTEVGIQEISFFYSQNSERTKFKTDRVIKKAIAAMKQSLSAHLPQINEPVKFTDIISCAAALNFIAHYHSTNQELKNLLLPGKSCLLLVGPEGDYTAREIEQAKESGFQPVNLGNNRLRTETAGLVACLTYTLANS
ncbi:MAG: 16S rRNA (uracil(1498)-N(3))-methyltransferase [Cyclobacteriaceae bacterium]